MSLILKNLDNKSFILCLNKLFIRNGTYPLQKIKLYNKLYFEKDDIIGKCIYYDNSVQDIITPVNITPIKHNFEFLDYPTKYISNKDYDTWLLESNKNILYNGLYYENVTINI
uniref:Uncharacterized protein n=1 Tax=Megaviridae environmental sample TaxID=1737588 RepID=A0A5J6VKT0_9VIRU|nr:MAG: hypothetical protein [Megaviridae environmental sample]